MEIRVVFVLFLVQLLCILPALQACDITKECPSEENVVWATDGKECHVFHNKCFLEEVNCHHSTNSMPQLREVSKESCQRLCIKSCPKDDNPVCGYYNDEKITFANQCEMESHICKEGMPLFVYGVGPCD